jgi:hypothetical protein
VIEYAKTIPPQPLPKPTNNLAKLGLRFERKFIKALVESAPANIYIISNPWFEYRLNDETHVCSPDFVICDETYGFGIVGEVKLNWTPLAAKKLADIYCPVLSYCSNNIPFKPLVVVKSLTPESPRPQPRLTWAFNAIDPIFHWTGLGSVLW